MTISWWALAERFDASKCASEPRLGSIETSVFFTCIAQYFLIENKITQESQCAINL